MWNRFQTSSVAPADRIDAWHQALTRSCGPFITHFGISPEQFNGEIDTRSVGGLDCVRVVQNAAGVRRTPKEIAVSDSNFFALILQVRGHSLMAQGSHEAHLQPGQMTLIDLQRPSAYRFSRDNVQLALHLPHPLVSERSRSRDLPVGLTLSGGSAAIAASFIQAAFENSADTVGAQATAVREALLTLLFANVFGDTIEANESGGRALLPVVQGYILAQLSDPNLSPASIAGAQGISVRHLHRLFECTGQTVGQWIRQQRLMRCADDLRNSALQVSNLTAIALQWGFSDSAHFSRAFKGEFGQTPSHYRLQRA